MLSAIAIAAVPPRWPKRKAAYTIAGKTTYTSGSSERKPISARTATAATTATASAARWVVQTGSRRNDDHASVSGTTISAPEASPSHQVRNTVRKASAETTLPAKSDSVPTTALMAVPTAI